MEWRLRNPRSFVHALVTILMTLRRSGTFKSGHRGHTKMKVPVALVMFSTCCHEANIQSWVLHQIISALLLQQQRQQTCQGEGSAHHKELTGHSRHACAGSTLGRQGRAEQTKPMPPGLRGFPRDTTHTHAPKTAHGS